MGNIYASLVEPIEIDEQAKSTLTDRDHALLFVNQGKLTSQRDFVIRTAELKRFITSISNSEKANKPFDQNEREKLNKVISALLKMIKDKDVTKPKYATQDAITNYIYDNMPELRMSNLKDKTLQDVFSKANKALQKTLNDGENKI